MFTNCLHFYLLPFAFSINAGNPIVGRSLPVRENYQRVLAGARYLGGTYRWKSKPTTAAEHFLSTPNYTANDMQLIPIEKIFSNRDSIRKAKEAFLISKGRTLVPHGLNYLVSYFWFPFIVFFFFLFYVHRNSS